MKTNAVMFAVLGVFLFIVALAYGWLTYTFEPGIEWVGFPAMLALAGLSFMISVFLWMNAKRHGRGAMDVDSAPVSSEAGIQGTFAPYSWSPLWCAIGSSMAFVGVPVGFWLTGLGVCVAMVGVISWVMEYSIGTHAH